MKAMRKVGFKKRRNSNKILLTMEKIDFVIVNFMGSYYLIFL